MRTKAVELIPQYVATRDSYLSDSERLEGSAPVAAKVMRRYAAELTSLIEFYSAK